MDHTRSGGLKPARGQVEGPETIAVLEIDVDPFAARTFGMQCRLSNELRADATALVVGTHLCIEQESVSTSVPRNVDEPDRGAGGAASGNPAEAVCADLLPPTSRGVASMRLGQRYQLLIGNLAAPAVLHLRNHAVIFAESVWIDALAGLDVVWVGIRCSPEVAEERNKASR